jgi:hypothetical protein
VLLAACAAPGVAPVQVALPAAAPAAVEATESVAAPVAVAGGAARGAADPVRVWIREVQWGIVSSVRLDVELLRSRDQYDAACTLRVIVNDAQGFPLPTRFEEKSVTVPLQAVRALTAALGRARKLPQQAGLVRLEPLDVHRQADVLIFPKDEGRPVHLSLEPPRDFVLHLGGPYLVQGAEVYAAYEGILVAVGLDAWAAAAQDAVRPGKGP